MSNEYNNIIREEDKEKAQIIKDNPIMLLKFRKVYNSLCRKCQSKAKTKVGINKKPLDNNDFCDKCRKMSERILK